MNVYKCKDTDGGGETIIVTKNMIRAVELFREIHKFSSGEIGQIGPEPEIAYDMSADGQTIYIDKFENEK